MSDSVDNRVRVVAIAGSLRKGSYNRAALMAAMDLLPPGMTMEIVEIRDLPMFDQDVEDAGFPEPVVRFHERLAAADAVLIATPEYNHGVPGVLKNAVDWASRPPGKAPIQGKPVGILGASTGTVGTARSQMELRLICDCCGMHVLGPPEVLIARAKDKFDQNGRLTDEATARFLGKLLAALGDWTRRLRPA